MCDSKKGVLTLFLIDIGWYACHIFKKDEFIKIYSKFVD